MAVVNLLFKEYSLLISVFKSSTHCPKHILFYALLKAVRVKITCFYTGFVYKLEQENKVMQCMLDADKLISKSEHVFLFAGARQWCTMTGVRA